MTKKEQELSGEQEKKPESKGMSREQSEEISKFRQIVSRAKDCANRTGYFMGAVGENLPKTAGEYIAMLKKESVKAIQDAKPYWKDDPEFGSIRYLGNEKTISECIGLVPDDAPVGDLAKALESKLSKKYIEANK